MTVTDKRVVVVDAQADTIDADAGSITYGDLAAVSVDGANSIELGTTEGVSWQFTLPNTNRDVVDAVVRHLAWVGEFRSRLLTCKNDIDLAAGKIRDHAEEMNWDEAEQIYEENRERLDRLISAAQWTKPIDVEDLAPELTDIERTLEKANARVYIERAKSQLDLSRQLIENEDYDLGGKPLRQARRHYERATGQAHAVERSDAFQFGTQRKLEDELDSLEWEIDNVAAAPMGKAREAEVAAEAATDQGEAIDHWETAHRRYDEVLRLNWGEGRTDYTGDADDAREGKEKAGTELVDLYTELAKERWDIGIEEFHGHGDDKEGLRKCVDASEALERAVELAEEYTPGKADTLKIRLDGLRRKLKNMDEHLRETAESEPQEKNEKSTDGAGHSSGSGSEIPSVTELSQLDTHHEITLEIKHQNANETNPSETTIEGNRESETTTADNDNSETTTEEWTTPKQDNGALFSESE